MDSEETQKIIRGSIFVTLGIIIIFIGFFFLIANIHFVNNSNPAQGITSGDSITFKINSGNETTISSRYIELLIKFSGNSSTMPILYNPEKPEKAKIDSFFSLWFPSISMIILSIIFIFVGIYEIVKD